jgi:N-acetylglucosaminyldiphosphoundecaprenol N-acetyl-beta-D-mannosaminyltransferase
MRSKFWKVMKFRLNNVNTKKILYGERGIYLYGDFNVLYHLAETKLLVDGCIKIYPDSTAVFLILKLLGIKSPFICSTDLLEEILIKAVQLKKRLYFFGDSNNTLEKLQSKLFERFNDIIISGVMDGYNYPETSICEIINASRCDILFVGLGLTRQEKWILENYDQLNIPIIISSGGWFQYLAGNKQRASVFLRTLHLEWFYKLSLEYSRVWKRYFITLPLFFLQVATGKIKLEVLNESFDI